MIMLDKLSSAFKANNYTQSYLTQCKMFHALCIIFFLPMLCHAAPREFRGAWLHTVHQNDYHKRSTKENQQWLVGQLDSLQNAGVNAVIFQVRPMADAFYKSDIEPWSRFLTNNGTAPKPFWDPLQFMVEQCHKRGMELHAWLNPYRVTSQAKQTVAEGHIYHKHPERFLRYDGKLYFDPGLPENRDYIEKVVADIVKRYDIDAIHFDDYFYPYPVKGQEFPDDKSYKKYGNGIDRGDWRRQNVDLLIEQLSTKIKSIKPWVRFGISPFGIWRNVSSDPRGSKTNGLQNYDGLFADVLLWDKNEWIDYLIPQLYWELDHKAASYRTLIDWWANCGLKRHLMIGQDVVRTMSKSELKTKVDMSRASKAICGNCWWPGYEISHNNGHIADSLAVDVQARKVLPPTYPWISDEVPESPKAIEIDSKGNLSWMAPAMKKKTNDAVLFAIYRFADAENAEDLNDAELIAVVPATSYKVPSPGVYVVTSLNRVNNESLPSIPAIAE